MGFLKKMKMGPKLISLFLLVGLLPLTVTGYLNYTSTSRAIDEETVAKLEAVAQLKKGQVEGWFSERRSDH